LLVLITWFALFTCIVPAFCLSPPRICLRFCCTFGLCVLRTIRILPTPLYTAYFAYYTYALHLLTITYTALYSSTVSLPFHTCVLLPFIPPHTHHLCTPFYILVPSATISFHRLHTPAYMVAPPAQFCPYHGWCSGSLRTIPYLVLRLHCSVTAAYVPAYTVHLPPTTHCHLLYLPHGSYATVLFFYHTTYIYFCLFTPLHLCSRACLAHTRLVRFLWLPFITRGLCSVQAPHVPVLPFFAASGSFYDLLRAFACTAQRLCLFCVLYRLHWFSPGSIPATAPHTVLH